MKNLFITSSCSCTLIFTLIFQLSSGIRFSSQSSKVILESGATFGIQKNIPAWTGTLEKKYNSTISGSDITFDEGYLNYEGTDSKITGVFNPTEAYQIQLTGDKKLNVNTGPFVNKINVVGDENKIYGSPLFNNSNSIRLENSNSELTLALQNALNSNIEMRGGTVKLENNLKVADDRTFTGSGTIHLQGHSLWIGGQQDLNLTHTLYWHNASDINLSGKTILSGTWTFTGTSTINGHGNILDITNNGTLYVEDNSTLNLIDIIVKGIGIDKGWFVFKNNTSQINMSNATIDLDNRFTVTIGGIYIDGPSTFILKNHNWQFDNYATLSVDGVTLWKCFGDYAGTGTQNEGDFLFQQNNKFLLNHGTIDYWGTGDNSNTIVRLDSELQTIDHGPNDIIITTTSYTMIFDVYLSGDHKLKIKSNCVLDGAGHTINFAKGTPDVFQINAGYNVTLQNVVLRNFSDAAILLGTGASLVFGNGTKILLEDGQILSIPWIFQGNADICGCSINIGSQNVQIMQGGNLTFKNTAINGLAANNLRCVGNATLTFSNSSLYPDHNYSLTSGNMQFWGDVLLSGTTIFNYQTNQTSVIGNGATLYLLNGINFNYIPIINNRDLIAMQDSTSILYLKGCTLSSTTTSMRLTKGTLIVEGANIIQNSAVSLSQATCFGNGVAADDLTVIFRPGDRLDVTAGILDYQNVS